MALKDRLTETETGQDGDGGQAIVAAVVPAVEEVVDTATAADAALGFSVLNPKTWLAPSAETMVDTAADPAEARVDESATEVPIVPVVPVVQEPVRRFPRLFDKAAAPKT